MDSYVEKARSAFYRSQTVSEPLTTLDTFLIAGKSNTQAALSWLKKLEDISMAKTEALLHEIETDRISEAAIDFAQRMLVLNQNRLLNPVRTLLE